MLMSDTAWPDEEYVRGIRVDVRDGFIDISYHDGEVSEEGANVRTHFYGKIYNKGGRTVIQGFLSFHWAFSLFLLAIVGVCLYGLLAGCMEMGVGVILIPGFYAVVWYRSKTDRSQIISHIVRYCG